MKHGTTEKKGSKNISALIQEVLNEKVTVKGPQGTHSMTKLKAGLTQFANKVAGGDRRSTETAVRWNQEIDERAPLLHPPGINVIVVDSKQLQLPRKVATNNSDG